MKLNFKVTDQQHKPSKRQAN